MSSIINEVVEAVILMMDDCPTFAHVTRGALPTKNAIVCEVAPSYVDKVFLDKNTYVPLELVINGKHKNLETLSDSMNAIHSALTRATAYPSGQGWQIVDISNSTLPQRIGREEDNSWLMASALSVKFYQDGD